MTKELRSYETWEKSLRNFSSWLGDATPGAMDLDALIERNKQFLIFEGKPWHTDQLGVSVNYGQHLALSALSEVPSFTVYLVGEDGERLWVARYSRGGPSRRKFSVWWPKNAFVKMTKAGLQDLARGWWQEAAAA